MNKMVSEKRLCRVKNQGQAVMEALEVLSSGVRELGQLTRECPVCDRWPGCRVHESFEVDFYAALSKVWDIWEEDVL